MTNTTKQDQAPLARALPCATLRPNPYQMWEIDQGNVQEIADSFAVHGQLQAILVRPHPKEAMRYEIAYGHHRLEAARRLGWEHIRAEVRELTDQQMYDYVLEENFKRRTPTPIEKAKALKRLTAPPFGLAQAEAGKRFGLTQTAVSNLMRLLRLPADVQQAVDAGQVPERLARQLVGLPEKIAQKAAQEVARAKPGEREAVLEEETEQALRRHGRDLDHAEFDLDWLEGQVIPVEHPKEGQPQELRACNECPHLFRRDRSYYCSLPGCFDLKQQRALDQALLRASARLGIPVAGQKENAQLLFERHDYSAGFVAKQLAQAFKKDNSLALRLVITPYATSWQREFSGSARVSLASLDKAACRRVLAKQSASSNGSQAAPDKKPTAAQAAAEEKARAARRAETAARWRREADVVWLVKNFAAIAAGQITISGAVLKYVVTRLVRSNRQQASNFYGLLDWYDELIEDGSDGALRQALVAAEVFESILPYGGPAKKEAWKDVAGGLALLATERYKRSWQFASAAFAGLAIKLPAGWDRPPVHKTEANCWTCGRFSSNSTRGRLAAYEIEAGWGSLHQGGKTLDVWCPDCGQKPGRISADKKAPAKRGRPKKAAAARAAKTRKGKARR